MSDYFGRQPGSYFDTNTAAHQDGVGQGLAIGRQKGLALGREEGYAEGHADGHEAGRIAGWSAAVELANQRIAEQLQFTRQHVMEKEALQAQLEEQRHLIEELRARLDAMELENANLKQSNEGLRQLANALQAANDRLQASVADLDQRFEQRTKQYHDAMWNYNRNMVFMNVVRMTLEDVASQSAAQARQVREHFAKHYGAQITNAMGKGTIKVPLDKDAELAASLPKTQRFILDMLSKVGHPSDLPDLGAGSPNQEDAEASLSF